MVEDLLRKCAEIPYNSAYGELPDYYTDRYTTWGLCCFGFAQLVTSVLPNSRLITGLYGNDIVHAATMVDGNYVDPLLRMKSPLLIDPSRPTEAPTYYSDSIVRGGYDPTYNILRVEFTRNGCARNNYTFNLDNQPQSGQPHGYRFSILYNGCPLTVNKGKTVRGTTTVSVKGASVAETEEVLQARYQIGLVDIAQMFYYASENSRYNDAQSSWR